MVAFAANLRGALLEGDAEDQAIRVIDEERAGYGMHQRDPEVRVSGLHYEDVENRWAPICGFPMGDFVCRTDDPARVNCMACLLVLVERVREGRLKFAARRKYDVIGY